MSTLPKIQGSAYARWLLPVSLALNICFVGAASAVAYRYTGEVPLSVVELINYGARDRLDRVAAALPPSDAQVMRAEIRADEVRVAAAQADLRLTQDEARNTLRAATRRNDRNAGIAWGQRRHRNKNQVLSSCGK